MKKCIYAVLWVLLICIFLFSSYKVYNYFKEEQESRSLTNRLIEEAVSERPKVTPAAIEEESAPKELPPISVDFDALWKTNQDIVAWIYCENTPINHPVAQSDDNSYYLRRLLNGNYNVAGTMFLDYRCHSDFTDRNSIIYGHNMKNDTMFGTLPKYMEQSYYEEHPVMWLLTPEENYMVELIAGFVTPSDSDSYDILYEDSDLEKYIEEALGNSTFAANIKSDDIERLVTLSTCSYEYGNARYVLLGRLEECE